MARRKGSKDTKPRARNKSGASVNGKHPPGENAASLTDDQARALHFIHVKEFEEAAANVKAASASRKTIQARIKAEGGSLDQIKASIEMKTPEGEDRITADITRKVIAARWQGSDIGNLQLDMFAAPDRSPILEKAYAEGKTAGLKGSTAATEYAADAEQQWLRGWHDGQDALKETLDLFRSPKVVGADPVSSQWRAENELSTEDGGQIVAGYDPNAGYVAGDGDEQVDSPPWMPEENLAELVDDDGPEIPER